MNVFEDAKLRKTVLVGGKKLDIALGPLKFTL
jgi:hypothetical protein